MSILSSALSLAAYPFQMVQGPITETLARTIPPLNDPMIRGVAWGVGGYYLLDYLKPQTFNIYVGSRPAAWKLTEMDNPDASYVPPWLIAGWMGFVGFAYI